VRQHAVDLDQDWDQQFDGTAYDHALVLDVFEHLSSPEAGLVEIFNRLKSGGKLYASTGNIAFLPVRLSLLLGWFNYGRKGILDLTHTRLFTVDSFRRLVQNGGFRIDKVIGFGPPLRDLSHGRSRVLNLIDSVIAHLARWWPSLFAYQIFIEATRIDAPADLMREMFVEPNAAESPADAATAESDALVEVENRG
jgi:hypothetical protein